MGSLIKRAQHLGSRSSVCKCPAICLLDIGTSHCSPWRLHLPTHTTWSPFEFLFSNPSGKKDPEVAGRQLPCPDSWLLCFLSQKVVRCQQWLPSPAQVGPPWLCWLRCPAIGQRGHRDGSIGLGKAGQQDTLLITQHFPFFHSKGQKGQVLTVEHRELCSMLWQPGWERSLGENGYMYTYGWVPSLSIWTITTLLIGYIPIKKEMATASSILAWRIPWTEGPGSLQFMGSQRVGHDWATEHTHTPTYSNAK